MSEMFGEYERVTFVMRRKDGKIRTVDLDGSYRPLIFQMTSTGHAVDVTKCLYVELQHVATTVQIEVSGTIAKPEPWRFDVPEVPAACVKGGTDPEHIFVQVSPGWWQQWSPVAGRLVGEPWPTREILEYAPLVECEDPRAAS